MTRLLIYLGILILTSSCSLSRYGHLTTRTSTSYLEETSVNKDKANDHSNDALNLHALEAIILQHQEPQTFEYIQLIETEIKSPLPEIVSKQLELDLVTSKPSPKQIDKALQKFNNKVNPQQSDGIGKSIWNVIGTLIVVFLFFAALAWVGTLFGIAFWTGMLYLAALALFIIIMDLLGLLEFWAGS